MKAYSADNAVPINKGNLKVFRIDFEYKVISKITETPAIK